MIAPGFGTVLLAAVELKKVMLVAAPDSGGGPEKFDKTIVDQSGVMKGIAVKVTDASGRPPSAWVAFKLTVVAVGFGMGCPDGGGIRRVEALRDMSVSCYKA
jgi:hypothetical protein